MTPDENLTDEFAIPSRRRRADDAGTSAAVPSDALPSVAPWALQHYFDGEIDLIKDLIGRFPQVPVMSLFNAREVGETTRRSVATMATQDGAASLVVDLDVPSRAVQFTFILNSMLALRFIPGKLTDADRAQFLEPMRGETGEVAFLWDQSRWSSDYLIGATYKSFANLFAFSPHHVEAAVRLTPEVTRRLLDWLDSYWRAE